MQLCSGHNRLNNRIVTKVRLVPFTPVYVPVGPGESDSGAHPADMFQLRVEEDSLASRDPADRHVPATCWGRLTGQQTQQTEMCQLHVEEDSLASRDPADKHVRSICWGRLIGQQRPGRQTCAIDMLRKTHWPAETRQTDMCQLHVDEDSLANRDPLQTKFYGHEQELQRAALLDCSCDQRITRRRRWRRRRRRRRISSTKTAQPLKPQPPAWQRKWKQPHMLSTWLPREVTARPHMLSASQVHCMSLMQRVKSGMESPDWQVSMFDIHLQRFLQMFCAGRAEDGGNDQVDRLAGKAAITGHLHLRRCEVSRSLRHYLQAWCQGHHTTDHLEETGIQRQSTQQSSFRSVNDGIHMLRTAHMCSTPSLKSYLQCCLRNASNIGLTRPFLKCTKYKQMSKREQMTSPLTFCPLFHTGYKESFFWWGMRGMLRAGVTFFARCCQWKRNKWRPQDLNPNRSAMESDVSP